VYRLVLKVFPPFRTSLKGRRLLPLRNFENEMDKKQFSISYSILQHAFLYKKMKLLLKINLILLIILGLATGVFKILLQEADVELFKVLGMNAALTTILGVLQVLGAVLLMSLRTRKYGALLLMATFVLASMAVFMNGMMVFGAVSLLFIVMAYGAYRMDNIKPKYT